MSKIICKFFPVGCADAILVSFLDKNDRYQNIFIDSGFQNSSTLLTQELNKINHNKEDILLWVITHWDNDHIEGIVKILEDDLVLSKKFIKNIWFNANYRIPKRKNKKEGYTGLKEGVLLRDAIQDQLKLQTPIITSEQLPIKMNGATITILSPTPDIYQKAISTMQVYAPVGGKAWDHDQTIEVLCNKKTPQDRRLENRSSIAFLLEYETYRLLFLGDASPVDIIPKLRQMGFSVDNPLEVDLLKVSHHGSKRNSTKELFSLIDTDSYVFTSDASERHKLPDKETIAKLLHHVGRNKEKHIKLFFNHHNSKLERIFDADGHDVFEKYNFSVYFPKPGHDALTIVLP